MSHTVLWPDCASASANMSETALASTPWDLTYLLYASDFNLSLLAVLHRPTPPSPTGRWRPQYAASAAITHPPAMSPTPTLREGQLAPAPASRLTSYHARYQTPPAARGKEKTYKKTVILSLIRLPRPHPATGKVDTREQASSPFRPAVGPPLSSKSEPRRDQPDPTLSNRVGYCPEKKPHPHGAIPNILPCSPTFRPPVLKKKQASSVSHSACPPGLHW